MKSIYFSTLAIGTLVLAGCQQQLGSAADVEDLRADVETLKTDVYGKNVGTCEDKDIIKDIAAYEGTLEGLPSADLEAAEWLTANAARENVNTTPTGLQYTVVKPGQKDGAKPDPTDIIRVNYHGFFPNGDKFDSAYDRGTPAEFPANRVIRGWVEGLGDMTVCEARTLYIPGDLAYGKQGRGEIPPNATLMFYVQLLGIEKKGLIEK